VPDDVQIRFGADIGAALSAIDTLKRAVTGAAEPVARLKTAFAEAGVAAQQSSTAALSSYRADLQRMVAEHALSLQQAIGFDIEYTARRSAEERARLTETLSNDAAGLAERAANYAELVALSSRYAAQLAQDQRRIAEVARREADRIALPYRQAFDDIGFGWRSAVTGLVEGTLTFQGAALRVAQSVERGFIGIAQTTLSRAAAGPLASLLGQAAPAAGEGVGDVLGNALSRTLFGAPQQLGQAAAATANTAALAANTAAIGALTASLGATAAASSAGAIGGLGNAAAVAGGAASVGTAASGGGLFSWLGGLFAFGQGGIVPSAARGWALPQFPGARPALLHAREMVLPAHISEGLQQMISDGGGGSNMHLHFNGPSDGPAVERWFTGLMARNPGVVRNMLRTNALTPRTL
jgi:hypothetical protein